METERALDLMIVLIFYASENKLDPCKFFFLKKTYYHKEINTSKKNSSSGRSPHVCIYSSNIVF